MTASLSSRALADRCAVMPTCRAYGKEPHEQLRTNSPGQFGKYSSFAQIIAVFGHARRGFVVAENPLDATHVAFNPRNLGPSSEVDLFRKNRQEVRSGHFLLAWVFGFDPPRQSPTK